MGEQAKKTHISAGLLAHVGASRREPHFHSFIPGYKTGDFSYSAEGKIKSALHCLAALDGIMLKSVLFLNCLDASTVSNGSKTGANGRTTAPNRSPHDYLYSHVYPNEQ